MKKKNILLFATFFTMVLTGCGAKKHEHTYALAESDAWTWVEGINEAWGSARATFECTSCKEEVEGHTLVVNATLTSEVTNAPTCENTGTKVYTATAILNEEEYTDTKVETLTALGHEASSTWSTSEEKHWHNCTNSNCDVHLDEGNHVSDNQSHYDGTNHWKVCSTCSGKYNSVAHTFDVRTKSDATFASEATCYVGAKYYLSCECGAVSTVDQFEDTESKLEHVLVKHDAVTPNCQHGGNVEYWTCSNEKDVYFKNAQGTEKFASKEEVELAILPHEMTKHDANEPTCTNPGNVDYWTCSYEDGVFYKDAQGREKFDNLSQTSVAAVEHSINENGVCKYGCGKSIKNDLGLVEVAEGDTGSILTNSNLGIPSPFDLASLGGDHRFVNYDFQNKKSLDWRFNFTSSLDSGDTYFYMYLGNQRNEDGFVFRFLTTRTDRYNYMYINNSTTPGCAAFVNQHILFKTAEPMNENGKTIRITMDLLNEATNRYLIKFYMSSDNGTTWAPSWTDNEGGTPFTGYEVEFGAGYFTNQHNVIRISNRNSSAVIFDTPATTSNVYVSNDDGTVIGKKENVTVASELPVLSKAGHRFLGWFDETSKKVTALPTEPGNHKVVARFVKNQEVMYDLSDFDFADNRVDGIVNATEDETFGYNEDIANVTGDRIDVYSIFTPTFVPGDPYAFFGFPYDAVDGQTRVSIRIALYTTPWYWNTYGTSIGVAGNDGTQYVPNGLTYISEMNYLLHMFIEVADEISGTYRVGFEVVNLGDTSTTGVVAKTFTFNNPELYSINNPERNRIKIGSMVGGGALKFRSAF